MCGGGRGNTCGSGCGSTGGSGRGSMCSSGGGRFAFPSCRTGCGCGLRCVVGGGQDTVSAFTRSDEMVVRAAQVSYVATTALASEKPKPPVVRSGGQQSV